MDESALELISIGTKLGQLTRPNKDALVKSFRQAVTALSQIEQPSVALTQAEDMKKLEDATKSLRDFIVENDLSNHTDKDVRLLVAICDIFKLLLSMFMELADTTSTFFSKRVKVLETIARCKCCVIMLDIGCGDLILEMFNIFFSVVRDHHQQSLINDILSIMTHILILNENVSDQLVEVLLRNLIQENKGATYAASRLAASVIQSCEEKLHPFIRRFLASWSFDRDAIGCELKEFYHEIVLKICHCAPEMFNAFIPTLMQELMTDQVDVRLKAVNLIGKLLLQSEYRIAQRYHALFLEFLKRFSDKSSEVRVAALQCAEACCLANPLGKRSQELLAAVEDRLLDFNDKVRMQAVTVACDLARSNLKDTSSKLIYEVTERLRDKKCAEGRITMRDDFEQIPCKVLMLCYDKDCKAFRSQNIELVMAEELFPVLLPVEERARHWIHLVSLFSPLHVKALSAILSQKRRFQTEMRKYLAIRKGKEKCPDDMQNKLKSSFVKMSASFTDPSKAEEWFHKLSQMKDNSIFTSLGLLLDEVTLKKAVAIRVRYLLILFALTLFKDATYERVLSFSTFASFAWCPKGHQDEFLKGIGDKDPLFKFLQLLSSKCSFNIFDSEHVCCILNLISTNGLGNKNFEAFSIELLLVIISNFPMLMRSSELQFLLLFEEKYLIHDKIFQILSKAGPHISDKFSDFYPHLKKICLEGTRTQSKYAVSAIASLIDVSKKYVFSELCEGPLDGHANNLSFHVQELVDSLRRGQNIATVLQSLGCIAQYSVSTFEDHDREITQLVHQEIFQAKSLDDHSVVADSSGCTVSCKLKIYGLKMLVKSFLPHQGSQVNRQINPLLSILLKMLQKGDMFDNYISCAGDKPFIRLAAAKSLLRLSRRWDLHISPDIFRSTVLVAKDPLSSVRRSFLDKIHKLLKERAIPLRYACAFTLAASDCLRDLQRDSFEYMVEFIKEYNREAQVRQKSMVKGSVDYPAYVVVFLIHVLAHDTGFPSEDCQDEAIYAQFCRPLLSFFHATFSSSVVGGDSDLAYDAVLYLNYIFRAIKRAKDAIDARITPANLEFLPQSFVKKVVDILMPRGSQPVGSVNKRGRKNHEDGAVSGKQFDFSTFAALEKNNESTRQEISLGHRQTCAVSPNAPGSVGFHDKDVTKQQEYSASNSYGTALEKGQFFSPSGSITEKSSQTESQVSTQKVERSNAMEGIVGTGKNLSARASNGRKVKFSNPYSSKEMTNANEALIGQRIRVWSTFDSCFLSGTVDDFNPKINTHKITYDSGEVEKLCLDSGSWETISDCSLTEREVVLSDKSNTMHLRQCVKDSIDKSKDDASHQSKTNLDVDGKIPRKEVPLSGKRKKGRSLSKDSSSISESVNIEDDDAVARRTRRRKALKS
ncbi:Armadillo-like helical [Corchorus olitorius]|uniref:Armadillo-like helical n=1 Tax=Corchorus olitorius TaxID=93759 RepID=A0A1R3GBT1_9ROSI|nr:Armadillo-like helical [Corchorus olitorius]